MLPRDCSLEGTAFYSCLKQSTGVRPAARTAGISPNTPPTPSATAAARAITGHATNGWWFFLVDQASRRSLRTVRRDYVDAMAVDVEDDEAEEDGDEDEA